MTIYIGERAAKLKKLSKILGLTSSNHAGERAAAAQKAADLLRELGMTWDEVIAPANLPVSPERPSGLHQEITRCLSSGVISARERKFLLSLSGRRYLSAKTAGGARPHPRKGAAMSARTLTKTLGGKVGRLYGLVRCPAHEDRKPSLSLRDGKHELIVNCFAGCGWQDVKAEFRRLGLLGDEIEPRRCPRTAKAAVAGTILSPKIDAADDDLKRRIKTARSLWKASVPLPDTLGWRYFTERRGLHIGVLGDLSHALRWHEGIGAVVALMTDAVTNKPCRRSPHLPQS